MATGTHGSVIACPLFDHGRVGECRHGDVIGADRNGAIACRFNQFIHHRRMGFVAPGFIKPK